MSELRISGSTRQLTCKAGRKDERKEERRGEGEVVRRRENEKVDEKGGQQVVVEDVTEWVDLKRNIRRRTTQGKHEEEGSMSCQTVQIFVKVIRSKAFPLGMSLSDKVSLETDSEQRQLQQTRRVRDVG